MPHLPIPAVPEAPSQAEEVPHLESGGTWSLRSPRLCLRRCINVETLLALRVNSFVTLETTDMPDEPQYVGT